MNFERLQAKAARESFAETATAENERPRQVAVPNGTSGKPNRDCLGSARDEQFITSVQPAQNLPYCIGLDFYEEAETLRADLEKRLSSSIGLDAKTNPLTYCYANDSYRCLTARAHQIFNQEVMLKFLDRMRGWGKEALGTLHASTPHVRIYIKGCCRAILRDDVGVKAHYLFSLTRGARGKESQVKILVGPISEGNSRFSVNRILNTSLGFNRLLIHDVAQPYGISDPRSSMNPLEGTIFLDGYLW
jgi:hypothetical protein